MTPRVVVTGIGAITSAGQNAQALADAVAAGRSCLQRLSDPRYRPGLRAMAGLVQKIPAARPERAIPGHDRFVMLALAASAEALACSKLPNDLLPETGVVVGTCSGPSGLLEAHYMRTADAQRKELHIPKLFLDYHAAAREIARVFELGGFCGTVTTACSAGTTAIGTGFDLIRHGILAAVLAGGSDAHCISTQTGFDGLKATCDGPCAPFSIPTGLSLGEGAAFLLLERLDSARARGAEIFAEIIGYGSSNDAYHCSAPDPSGSAQALAITRALKHAGLQPEHVGYVNAHGTGTDANDKAETRAIRRAFGAAAERMPVSSQKAVFGHTLGAAGAIETAAAMLCRKRGVLPPTANFSTARAACNLDYVPLPGRVWPQQAPWIKENFAFGGHNACLAIGPPALPGSETSLTQTQAQVCITGIGVITPDSPAPDALSRMAPGNAPPCTLISNPCDQALARKLGINNETDKASVLATVAAYHALHNAGINMRPSTAEKIGLYMALSSGSNRAEKAYMEPLIAADFTLQSVTDFPFMVPNSTAGSVSRNLGLKGHHAVFCLGVEAGLGGLFAAACAVANHHAEIILAGSVDVLTQRPNTHPVEPGPPPPMEAAVFFALESESHAMARNAPILAFVDTVPAGPEKSASSEKTACAEACDPLLDIAALLREFAQPTRHKPLPASFQTRHAPSFALLLRPTSKA